MRQSCLLCAFFLTVSAPAGAQELTDGQLLELFQQQRDAVAAAQSGDLGATRGLELISVDDLTTSPELAPAEETSTETGETASIVGVPEPDPVEADAGVTPVETIAAEPADPVIFADIPDELQVNVRVTFPFDSATLGEDQLPKLEQLCNVMKASDIALFRIVGHTDAAGTDDYNERLSLLRAQEVRRYFVDSCGMGSDRLEAVGMGERFLVDPDDPRAADNRRVEFQALS